MKRIVVCGVSHRGLSMYVEPILTTFHEQYCIAGLLDLDPQRFVESRKLYAELEDVPCYGADEFDRMIEETEADIVLVAGTDHTHAEYIVRALRHDLDVISEKPMAVSGEQCRAIWLAERSSKGKVTVAFNYRFSPYHRQIKELVAAGKVGRVTSVDLNWYVDTHHGSSYFKRWNRKRSASGGLSIHKSTHHFDLVNWWIAQKPEEVFAYGSLNFFGPEGEWNPQKEDGRHCETCKVKANCRYVMRWTQRSKEVVPPDDHLHASVSPVSQRFTSYRPDACIFDSEIDIEDTYSALVKYDGGALLNYSILFSAPYEGYRLAINGTKGRIETMQYHAPARVPFDVPPQTIDYIPLFGSKETIGVVPAPGGHGGGDPLLLEELFLGVDPLQAYGSLAGASDGAYSVAVGEAVSRSIREKRAIAIEELLQEAY
ncbi:Gfo/Idh/MocA family oxidoreductase [Paenibacillus sp. HB172176]|uniref:Gfo/Idh/MocA family protein n=1 Tax=Paenibacillus sp. HB172176 TaxID=2493690 RepID=UPI00143BCACE|nr:Gfo/Idh/MocA family oxidoreductase [Paenibacillus sp. HB172176]